MYTPLSVYQQRTPITPACLYNISRYFLLCTLSVGMWLGRVYKEQIVKDGWMGYQVEEQYSEVQKSTLHMQIMIS